MCYQVSTEYCFYSFEPSQQCVVRATCNAAPTAASRAVETPQQREVRKIRNAAATIALRPSQTLVLLGVLRMLAKIFIKELLDFKHLHNLKLLCEVHQNL